jgi:hypothetical protein
VGNLQIVESALVLSLLSNQLALGFLGVANSCVLGFFQRVSQLRNFAVVGNSLRVKGLPLLLKLIEQVRFSCTAVFLKLSLLSIGFR